MDERVSALHAALPTNAMFIVCTGHGDTSIVHRFVSHLVQETDTVSL